MAKKRAPRGGGTVFWSDSRQRWIGRRVAGRDANGRTVYHEVSDATQAGVLKKLANAGPPLPTVTVAAWAKRWLAGPAARVRASTRASYEVHLHTHLLPAIGRKAVAKVTRSDVEAITTAQHARGLSSNTTRLTIAVGRMLFDAAVAEKLITSNPFRGGRRRPVKARRKIDPFTPAELRRILDTCHVASAGPLIAVLASTGCRLGEAAALDVPDWTGGQVRITKTYNRGFGVGPPKSAQGVRTIEPPAAAVPFLEDAARGRTEGPLFVTGNGRRWGKEMIRRGFLLVCRRAGLRPRNPHQLRHSVATGLISAGVPLGDVARYLGDRVETVVASYLHPTGASAAPALDRMLNG